METRVTEVLVNHDLTGLTKEITERTVRLGCLSCCTRRMNVVPVSRPADGEWLTLVEQEVAEDAENEFASLVTRQSRFVFRIASAVLRNVEDAEDVTQEAFFKLFRSGSWRCMEDEKAFLARMVWQLAVNKRPSRYSVLAFESSGIASGYKSPERTAIVNERRRTIYRLIDSLPKRLKRPLILSSVEDLTPPK